MVSVFVLVLSLVALNNITVVLGQSVPQKEICNGKDDNGDGQIDEGIYCDHYLSYLIDKPMNSVNVVLRDQFIQPTDFQLVAMERLFNPAKKNHAGMTFDPKRPDLHYLAYQLKTPAPFTPRSVVIENQFEKKIISVTKPRYLLAPAGKRKLGAPIENILSHVPASVKDHLLATIVPAIPQNANHYLCYDVEPYDISAAVLLKDQFQQSPFKIMRARYLCNPAEKMHEGLISRIVDETNHLMCYEVIPHNQMNRKVITHDQFGIKAQHAIRTEEICVPTIKTHVPVSACVRPDDHGTAILFDADTKYTGGQVIVVQPSPASTGITANAMLMSGPTTLISRNGSPSLGETYIFDTEMLQLSLSGGRVLNIPVSGEIGAGPRTAGDPIQHVDTHMQRLQGQLPPGDPDFDLLRISAGASFGMPSPGHTTLTQLPDGNWNVDSFFDITYRIDFVGAPNGPLAGRNGSSVGTVRIQGPCPHQP